ncbi:MAG TPA: hypothetical protein VM307_06050 [Egibacteraceae bacterium]|nr:hypothetical protein [Egibacteraceae bacterium]
MTTPTPSPPTLLDGADDAPAGGGSAGAWLPSARGRGRRLATGAVLVVLVGAVGGLSAAALTTTLSPDPRGDARATPGERQPEEPTTSQRADTPERAAEQPSSAEAPRPNARWVPVEAEVYPNAKRLAARVVERLTSYEAGTTRRTAAAKVARRFGVARADVADAARELVRPGTSSVGTVVYPQLGGVAASTSSVMVVVDQELDDGARRWTERRTVDVRLRLVDGGWALDRLGSGGGAAVDAPERLSAAAWAVLAHEAIELTDSARWDIYHGMVDDRLLSLMVSIGDRHEIAVATLATGHPPNVWSTDRPSNHTRGRAVDIFRVDGELVVEQREKGSAAHRLTRWLFKQGVPELGSPWALDGFGGRSFTDVVHADHVHVAV